MNPFLATFTGTPPAWGLARAAILFLGSSTTAVLECLQEFQGPARAAVPPEQYAQALAVSAQGQGPAAKLKRARPPPLARHSKKLGLWRRA